MDTTKQNILMCEKAWEIQKLFNPKEFNFLWDGILRNSWDKNKYTYIKYIPFRKTAYGLVGGQQSFLHYDGEYTWSCIWLPTQAQLQNLLITKNKDFWYIGSLFQEWVDEMFIVLYYKENFKSMEQLWLAFCMHELYQKKWSGTDWVKDE